MGYYTHYELTVTPLVERDNVLQSIEKQVGYDPFGERCKWYGHEQDILVVSKLHPTTILSLHGVGEEQGDEWILHARNGEAKKHRAPKWEPPGPPQGWEDGSRIVTEAELPKG